MEYSKVIKEIMLKEGYTYDEIRQTILDVIQEVNQGVWEIDIDNFKFPIPLDKNEMFELLEFFFLDEYDEAVYVTFLNEGKILIECDKHYGGFMLAFISLLAIGVFTLIILMFK